MICKALMLEITKAVSTDRKEIGKLSLGNTPTFRDPEDAESAKKLVNELLMTSKEYQKSVVKRRQ